VLGWDTAGIEKLYCEASRSSPSHHVEKEREILPIHPLPTPKEEGIFSVKMIKIGIYLSPLYANAHNVELSPTANDNNLFFTLLEGKLFLTRRKTCSITINVGTI
jgi:hypothetical protein